jgi:hypothetical protein
VSRSSWGAIVQGDKFDLEDWADALKPSFDPWIEIYGDHTVLRSSSFDELTSGELVQDRAIAYIDRLNGAFAISHKSKPLSFYGIVEISADGQRRVFTFAVSVMEGRSKVRGVSQAIGPDGQPIISPPQASEVQRWSQCADRDELLDDALIFYGKSDNWFNIYNALESLFNRVGGEKNFLALGWESEGEIKRLKRTANWGRHARGKHPPPPNPMPMKEGRELLGRLLRRA